VGHVVLLGDSIFDNERYVPDRPPVIEQLRQRLPASWSATLLAVDGHVTEDVARQMTRLPEDATHLVVSVGGNDALGEAGVLRESVSTVGEAMMRMDEVRTRFREAYRAMLAALRGAGRPAAVCTIYDAIPGLEPADRTALAGFNEVILREAFAVGLSVIDLRLICDRAGDYSHVSPIEPSAIGGAKIARVIAEAVTAEGFDLGYRVYR
jgi:GDSL-like Lipase/Acylhydrolase family